jgi:hypothetical protein
MVTRVRKDGRSTMTASPTTTAIVNGVITDFSDWDEEELTRGRRRDKNGNFTGKPPQIVAAAAVRELNKARMRKAQEVLNGHLLDAVGLWGSVVRDTKAPLAIRFRASELIVDRVMGKVPEHVSVQTDGESPWQVLIAKAIINTLDKEVEASSDIEVGEIVPGQEG